MARLTNLFEADTSAISKTYGLEFTHCQAIAGGDENSSFLLNGGNQTYVLTIYEKRSLLEIEQQVFLLKHLAMHDFHTNQVLPTVENSSAPVFQGKPVMLKTWIPGETLRDSKQSDFRSIGASMAELHKIPAPGFLPEDHPYGLRLMSDSCDHQVDLGYEAWLSDKIAYLQDNFPDDLPRSLIHGDLFDDNIIYHEGQFKAIIDFGEACHYTRAFDIGSILFGACMVDGKLDLERAAGVLGGYQGRLRLEPGEREAIQFFAVYAGAAISAWHYLHTFLKKPLESRLDKYKLAAARTENLFKLKPSVYDSFLD